MNDTKIDVQATLNQIERNSLLAIGFPAGRRIVDFKILRETANILLNNVSETEPRNTLEIERSVIERCGRWFGFGEHTAGYLTSGSTIAILQALRCAELVCGSDAIVYYSQAAHTSVERMSKICKLPVEVISTNTRDQMQIDQLACTLNSNRPAIVVATAGTTMLEAVDDIPKIRELLKLHSAPAWLHIDGALSGPPLALSPQWRHLVTNNDGPLADSVNFSTAKFFGCPTPAATFLTQSWNMEAIAETLPYTNSNLTTVETSRNGRPALEMAVTLDECNDTNLYKVAQWCRACAEAVTCRLRCFGILAHRYPWAFTVSFPQPQTELVKKYSLAVTDNVAHLIVMPGVWPWILAQFCSEITSVTYTQQELVEDARKQYERW